MGLFNALVTDTSYAMTTNFANVMKSVTDFQSVTFSSVWDSLHSLDIIESSLDGDFKDVEEKLGASDVCLLYYRMRLQSYHYESADGVSNCVNQYISGANRDFASYQAFFKTWQDKTMLIPLIMLNDLAQTNPISKATDLVEKLWPSSYVETHNALRIEYDTNSNMFYSLVKQSLETIALPLYTCLNDVEHSFEVYVGTLRSGLLSECVSLQSPNLELDLQ